MANEHVKVVGDPLTITRGIVKRAWADIEPKVAAGLASGSGSIVILEVLTAMHIHLTPRLTEMIPVFCTVLAAYITPSVGTISTIRHGDDLVVEKHGGNVEIKTGAIPIQAPPLPEPLPTVSRGTGGFPPSQVPRETPAPAPVPAPAPAADPAPEPFEVPDKNDSPGFTQVIQPQIVQPEQSRASAFISQLPSSKGTRGGFYDDEDSH